MNAPTSHESSAGTVFAREQLDGFLILSPISHVGSLAEDQILRETAAILETINHTGPTNVVVDLARSDYLGTALLGAVVRLWKRVAQRGGRLALCNVSANIVEVLRITKLQTAWPIYGSRQQAIEALRGFLPPGQPR
jgi:anti-anti-sigma factor